MNPMEIFKNLQNLQSRVGEMQDRMKEIVVSGSSGGDMVRIDLNGQMEVQKVTISPEAVDPDDIGMLQDLIFAAFRDAGAKLKEKMKDEMSSITGGLDIPPGFLGM